MGGGPEEDGAARRFAEAAAGGDIVVLRATGSLTSYPDYFSAELAPSPRPASVVTIRTDAPPLANHPSVLCRLGGAEAIWLAGGSQWDYLGRWPHEVRAAVREATQRGAALGGTSAGAVSLGEAAFDARHGTIASGEALSDPADAAVSVGPSDLAQPELANVIVDSHFTERSREGRLLAFLGRLLAEHEAGSFVGIGIDEGAALEIEDGGYRVSSVRGGGVWMYEATGPAVVQPGRPLSLEGVRRVRLAGGASGRWPFSFDEAEGVQELVVEEGKVRAQARPSRSSPSATSSRVISMEGPMRITWPPIPPSPTSTPSSRAASRSALPSRGLGSFVTGSSTSSRPIISPMPRTSPIHGWAR